MTDLSTTDVAFTTCAATFAVAAAINIMAGWEYLGLLYAVLAIVLVTYVQVDRTRRDTRNIRELLEQWPPLPRSNDTTAAHIPGRDSGPTRWTGGIGPTDIKIGRKEGISVFKKVKNNPDYERKIDQEKADRVKP